MTKIKNNGKFTDSEWEELASLLSGEHGDQDGLLQRFVEEDPHNTSKNWKELANMNDEKEINVNKAWNTLYSRIKGEEPGTVESSAVMRVLRNRFFRVAASVLIILSLAVTIALFINPELAGRKITIATNSDQKNIQVALPDGSRIFLNRNSEFTYSSRFGKRERNVRLTGEAFFEIAPDPSKPFVINAGNASVRVVGTSFNVITKNNDEAVEVFVKTGKVMLSDNSGSGSIALDPGYVGTMANGKPAKVLNNNPNYLSWNTGLLVYNGQTLDVVISDLKRVYNMDIVADDKSILENRWTSPIDNQPPVTIIRLICASFNLSYKKDGDVYHLIRE